ncbi:MAG TPA: hypothetical protein VG651_08885 [Stellaceae bacterium]|nr:hypothetical protein [Stellaceae bacterium]
MFENTRFRFGLWRTRRRHRKWEADQQSKIIVARRRHANRQEIEDLEWDYRADREFHEDEIAAIQTRYLLDEADRLLVPRPPVIFNDESPETSTWVRGKNTGVHLSPKTMVELRDAIRRERKERSEVSRLWLSSVAPVIASIAGLLGVVIGLVAALKK